MRPYDSKALKTLFENCASKEDIYQSVMKLGQKQRAFTQEEKSPEHLVKGCQSELYLLCEYKEEKLFFEAYSEALISAGLAQLLILFYSGRSPEEVLKLPPDFLEDIGITGSLTPSRTNGLYSVHLMMKQHALKAYMSSSAS